MITQNLYNLLAQVPVAYRPPSSQSRIVLVTGQIRYITPSFTQFPNTVTTTLTTTPANAGISIGSGTDAENLYDYQLAQPITQGVSLSMSSVTSCMITPDNSSRSHPAVVFNITVTNTSSEELTVTEICYKQSVQYLSYPNVDASNVSSGVVMLDRTLLESPIVIQPGDAGIIEYTLYTYISPSGHIGDIDIVDFTWGSDEAISAMITAARNGTIDLARDAGWRVGDVRPIHIDTWTGGGDTVHPAQDAYIMISQFGSYNGSGSLFQFDILWSGIAQRMHSSTALTRWEDTEMYTTSLPALYSALPEWLRSLMIEFDIDVGQPQSQDVYTISDNKLSLRASVEILGSGNAYSRPGEGIQADIFNLDTSRRTSTQTWTRTSSLSSPSTSYVMVNSNSGSYSTMTSVLSMAVFGCI